jgi:hypothetical protein
MNHKQKAIYEDSIPEEELPVRAGLKVIRQTDLDYGLSDDEIADRNEYIRCYLLREFELLLMVPIETEESEFFFADVQVTDGAYSAFCTVDFQKTLKPFDKYGYAMEKIMERVKNLAILHSAISHQEGRENIIKRFQALVEVQFREGLLRHIDQYQASQNQEQKERLKKKIGELNRRILECQKIWERYAPWDE